VKTVRAVVLMLLVAIWFAGAAGRGADQTGGWRSVSFHFMRGGVQPGRYTIELDPEGKGFYWEGQPDYDLQEVPPGTAHTISVSRAALTTISEALGTVSSGNCETRRKNVAQSGRKTIVFLGRETSPQCEFNYSDDERVNAAAVVFESVSETIQFGERLKREHRFDKLGLDAELDSLIEESKGGRAMELQNIAPLLQSLVADDTLMDRVRSKAQRLLDQPSGDASAERPR